MHFDSKNYITTYRYNEILSNELLCRYSSLKEFIFCLDKFKFKNKEQIINFIRISAPVNNKLQYKKTISICHESVDVNYEIDLTSYNLYKEFKKLDKLFSLEKYALRVNEFNYKNDDEYKLIGISNSIYNIKLIFEFKSKKIGIIEFPIRKAPTPAQLLEINWFLNSILKNCQIRIVKDDSLETNIQKNDGLVYGVININTSIYSPRRISNLLKLLETCINEKNTRQDFVISGFEDELIININYKNMMIIKYIVDEKFINKIMNLLKAKIQFENDISTLQINYEYGKTNLIIGINKNSIDELQEIFKKLNYIYEYRELCNKFEVVGPLNDLMCKFEYLIFDQMVAFSCPISKFKKTILNLDKLIKYYSFIPKGIKNVCLEIIGKNIQCIIFTCLMDNSSGCFLSEGVIPFTINHIFNKFSIPYESLNENNSNYLILLGRIILELEEIKQDFSFRHIKELLEARFVSPNILAIDSYTLSEIQAKFCPEKTIPYAVEINNGICNELKFMCLMASLSKQTRLECVKWVIEQFQEGNFLENLFFESNISLTKGYTLFSLLSYLEENERLSILSELCQTHEKGLKVFFTPSLSFGKVFIQTRQSVSVYSQILLQNLIEILPMTHLREKSELSINISAAIQKSRLVSSLKKINAFSIQKGDKFFGRTIVRQKVQNKISLKAYKFLKENEKQNQLVQEAEIIKVLTQSGIFRSTFPAVKQIREYKRIEANQEPTRVISGITLQDQLVALVSEVPKEYYHYLHLVDHDQFQQGRERWLHDSLTLLRNGLFHESTPMYHNNAQNRPYIFLTGFLHASNVLSWLSAGRLDTPRLYNQYPNVGETGCRDFGDLRSLEELATDPGKFSKDLSLFFIHLEQNIEKRKSMLTANFIATHRLVDTLLLAMSLEKDPTFKWNWKSKKCRKRLMEEGIRGMALTISGYSGEDYKKCEAIAKDAVDWNQWAKEILFWWRTDQKDNYTKYLDYGDEGLPTDPLDNHKQFYPNGCQINLEGCVNYLKGFGFCDVEKVKAILNKRIEVFDDYSMKELRKDSEAKLYLDVGAYNSSLLLHTLEIDGYFTAALSLLLAEERSSNRSK